MRCRCFCFLVAFCLIGASVCAESKLGYTVRSSFAELEGVFLKYAAPIKNSDDHNFYTLLEKTYNKYRDRQFHEVDETLPFRIPHILHVIWVGPNNFPADSVENMRTWVAENPGWTFKFWTDRMRPPPCKEFELCMIDDFKFKQLKPMYDQATNWGEKADYLRYELLNQQGGVYADHDANCLKSFDQLNQAYDFYGCLEVPHDPIRGRVLTLGIGVIGSKPHHPILESAVNYIVSHHKQNDQLPDDGIAALLQRSYFGLTYGVLQNIGQGDTIDIVFPASYFYPKWELPAIYSRHFYKAAWVHSCDEAQEVLKLNQNTLYLIKEQSRQNKKFKIKAKFLGRAFTVLICLTIISIFFSFRRKPC